MGLEQSPEYPKSPKLSSVPLCVCTQAHLHAGLDLSCASECIVVPFVFKPYLYFH